MVILIAFTVLLALLGTSHSSLSNEYQNKVQLDDLGMTYMLYWSLNASEAGGMMYFAVEVKTTGWVAFGFANKIGGMDGYDIMTSYVLSADKRTEFTDCITNGHKVPPVDNIQNYYLRGSSEVDGTTTISFKRKLKTGDNQDIDIKPGKMWVVWAYYKFDNTNRKHDKRGYKQLSFISSGNGHGASLLLLLTTLLGSVYLYL